jgi:predicted GNAT family acetyltransferase
VRSVLGAAGARPTVVATGRDNTPARALYERLGFTPTGDREVLPGLWVTGYRHDP